MNVAAQGAPGRQGAHQLLLHRLWSYEPELPPEVLSAAQGLMGDTRNLERVLLKMLRGANCPPAVQQRGRGDARRARTSTARTCAWPHTRR